MFSALCRTWVKTMRGSLVWKKAKGRLTAPLRITLAVLAEIRDTIGSLPPEHGGVLGGRSDEDAVTEFYFDRTGERSSVSYTPDDTLLRRLFAEDWNRRGVRFRGFVHSHPGLRGPSSADVEYSKRILEKNLHLDRLVTPIVIPAVGSDRFEILPFAVLREGDRFEATELEMIVIDADGRKVIDWVAEIEAPGAIMAVPDVKPVTGRPSVGTLGPAVNIGAKTTAPVAAFLERVVQAYDLDLMARSRIVCVGTGGAAGLVEDLSRAGVRQFVPIDPDVVNEPNLATQQTYRRDLGRPKVDVLADRIRDINPQALVIPLQRSLEDINDAEFELLARGQTDRWPVSQTLICGFTDSFYAQARVNRLALQFGLPSLCAQMYKEGRAAEITFTHPDVTPACQRCVLASRYRAYLEEGFENDVTSNGAPVFATTRLNALTGFVTLALLHHGSAHPRWGPMLARMGSRNRVQIRMDPDLATTLGVQVFDRVFKNARTDMLLFDEPVWVDQQPTGPTSGNPVCPDCHGTGKLRDRIGTFDDTRPMTT